MSRSVIMLSSVLYHSGQLAVMPIRRVAATASQEKEKASSAVAEKGEARSLYHLQMNPNTRSQYVDCDLINH